MHGAASRSRRASKAGEGRQRDHWVLIVIALCSFVLCGRSSASATPVLATLSPTAVQSVLQPAASPVATLPPGTPQPIDAALDAVTHAMAADDATPLTSLLLEQVLLARGPAGDGGVLVTRAEASTWLQARWGKQRSIVSHDYVEHFEMLEITSQGWANLAPLEQGRIIFHLHRYNARGQGDTLNGQWRIDAILYQ